MNKLALAALAAAVLGLAACHTDVNAPSNSNSAQNDANPRTDCPRSDGTACP